MATENSGLMADIMCEVFSDSLKALISVQCLQSCLDICMYIYIYI